MVGSRGGGAGFGFGGVVGCHALIDKVDQETWIRSGFLFFYSLLIRVNLQLIIVYYVELDPLSGRPNSY